MLALAEGADLVVTLGGASVGDFDLVQRTALDHGMALDFYKVAIRPGKPLMAGRIGGQRADRAARQPGLGDGLRPGVRRARRSRRCSGLGGAMPTPLPARLGAPLGPNGPRTHYMRARVEAGAGGWICVPFERQDSSLLSVLAAANALMVRAPRDPARAVGDKVEFIWL